VRERDKQLLHKLTVWELSMPTIDKSSGRTAKKRKSRADQRARESQLKQEEFT
jgi:hypothetical protein